MVAEQKLSLSPLSDTFTVIGDNEVKDEIIDPPSEDEQKDNPRDGDKNTAAMALATFVNKTAIKSQGRTIYCRRPKRCISTALIKQSKTKVWAQ